MTKKFVTTGLGAAFALALVGFALFALGGTSSASTPTATTPTATLAVTPVAAPSMAAIAIGQLNEASGESATVDLHATIRAGKAGGALRFFSSGDGYYNGGVKTLTCQDGVISVTGGGGFVKSDGTRIHVTFVARFDRQSHEATITVTGKNFEYTLNGHLDGLIWCGDPKQAPPTA
jgi:hypothetical protein